MQAIALSSLACAPAAEQAPRAAAPADEAHPATRRQANPVVRGSDAAAATGPRHESAGPKVKLVDSGQPPRRALRYEMVSGSTREFRVEHRLALFEQDQELGSLEVQAPLTVAVTEHPLGYTLGLQLGPARIVREGRASGMGWGGEEQGTEEPPAHLLAQVNLNASGVVEAAHIAGRSSSALGLLFETLLDLDAPPSPAVGAGARWHTERSQAGGGWTKTEYELVEMLSNGATFRVQREQVDGRRQNGVRAVGEWTFNSDAWPPTGHDQVTAAVPESGPGARVSVRFAVTSIPAEAHTHTKQQAP